MDWTSYYPAYAASETASPPQGTTDTSPTPVRQLTKTVTIADIGCGFGGLLVALAKILPEELLLGKLPSSSLLVIQADIPQDLSSAHKSRPTCKIASAPSALKSHPTIKI